MNKEFKALQKENDKITDKIDRILQEYLSTADDNYADIWEEINKLVENEIEQEKLCNE